MESGGRKERCFLCSRTQNDVFLFQTLALPSKLLGRGCWLRAPGIGVRCLPGVFGLLACVTQVLESVC